MGHESRIELWSPNLTIILLAGFGTDRLRCEQAMKTAGRGNPNRWPIAPSNRAPGADGQNRSCSIKWAEKEEKFRPMEECFSLTSPFIELTRQVELLPVCALGPAGGMFLLACSKRIKFPRQRTLFEVQRNEGSNNCSLARLRIDVELSAN
jgi:hypothetical protein